MSSQPPPPIFAGWLADNASAVKGNLRWTTFTPKPFTPDDIDIRITHCGICGSDIHTLRSGWGRTRYPVCVGHEIVGRAVRVGSAALARGRIRPGDRVGVGAQSASCLRPGCEECAAGLESYCPRMVATYNGRYPDGSWSQGGYGDYARVPERFVVRIPQALESRHAAPMLCGGITVFSPLRKNGAGPEVRVGIVGLGGLGHFGILFARALGAKSVVAISRRSNKKDDALALGADTFIATDEEQGWHKKHSRSLDLIICTVSGADMPLERYLSLLRTNGQIIQVGAPEDKLPSINAFHFLAKGIKLGGSSIGSPKEIEEMLEFAAEKGVKPWVQERSLQDANQAVVDMENGKARYRYVLANGKHADDSGAKL